MFSFCIFSIIVCVCVNKSTIKLERGKEERKMEVIKSDVS